MAIEQKRITFVLTPEMELSLAGIKKEMFYNCSQSEMIRTLVKQGLNVIKDEKLSGFGEIKHRDTIKQLV